MKVKLDFRVTVQFDTTEGGVLNPQSMEDNLLHAIELARQDGHLTPTDISADWVEVEHVLIDK